MKHVPTRLRPLSGLLLVLASVLAASSGCSRKALEGVVVTVRGETLPGVAVAIKGTDFQAVTDGVGQYRLPAIAGTHAITFAKTGYTPGLLELTIDQPRPVTATTVSLAFARVQEHLPVREFPVHAYRRAHAGAMEQQAGFFHRLRR